MSSTFNSSLRIVLALLFSVSITLSSFAQTPFTCSDLIPSSNTTVSGATTNFSWTAMPNADQYQVLVGSTTGIGNYNTAVTSTTNYLVSGYPTNGSQFWVTIKVMDQCGNIIKETSCSYTAPNITTICTGTSYDTIAANAPSWNCLVTHNEYLGAYLAQHPDVAFWNHDTINNCIDSIGPPTTDTVFYIASTGNDDAAAIRALAATAGAAFAHPEINGNGDTFKVSALLINMGVHSGVTFKNMNFVPFTNSTTSRRIFVNKPDVSFINCTLDLQNKNARFGFEVAAGHRFALINCAIYNYYNTTGNSGAMLKLYHDVDDAYVVNNIFKHGIATGSPSDNSKVRGIVVAQTSTVPAPSGGIIASNLFEDIQCNAAGDDSDGISIQGFSSPNQYAMGHRMLILANIGIDAGKRLVKLQSGGADLHSNSSWWKTGTGDLGTRVTRAHYDNQGVSSTRWTNNFARSDSVNGSPSGGSENYFMTMQNNRWVTDPISDDNIFRCNKYECNVVAGNGKRNFLFASFNQTNNASLNPWPLNSEFTNNIVTGTGTLEWVWWFRAFNTSAGGNLYNTVNPPFLHAPNTISISYGSLYR